MNGKLYVHVVDYNVGDSNSYRERGYLRFNMVDKKITMSGKGEIHFGVNSLPGFESATNKDIENVLADLKGMKLWRCIVCNDLHIGVDFPKECPTCHTKDACVEIDVKEFRSVLEAING